MGNFEKALSESLEYFGGDELAANVFVTKYALTDRDGNILETNPEQMHRRLASEFHRIESRYKNPLTQKEIFELFDQFKYVVPQGSPMSGIGNQFQVQSISNCFVIESPFDSYGGILKVDQELVQIAKRRGGVGFDVSTIRPKGQATGNCARTTDGIEVFMDRFSNSCREVAQNGRRGALMLTISVHHPQVLDFIKIKRDLKRVTGANISVRLTDEFMKAVKEEKEVQLRWPVDSKSPDVSKMASANEIWDQIIESAHACAEPGILFWDTAKSMTPADIYTADGFGSTSTNPCGEIILSPYDSCRLMLVNLTSFVDSAFTKSAKFDWDKFSEVVIKTQRLMDDMIDLELEQIDKIINKIESDPEPSHVKAIELDMWNNVKSRAIQGRRTGLGITGLGDMLASLGITYGSKESIKMTEEVYSNLATSAYKSSCILAKERGSFPVHDHNLEKDHPFLSRIWEKDPEILELSKKFGRRNIAITTTAPAGSVSVLTQTTSGIEPAFMLHYMRRKKLTENDLDGRVDFTDDSGDKWQEYTVYHHGFKKWMETLSPDTVDTTNNDKLVKLSPYSGATANEIDWVAKVKMQAAAQKWVCHAISNTTNLPADTSIETVKSVYMAGWESGCKGVTIYRDGCRTGVLVSNEAPDISEQKIQNINAPRRPETLSCEIHRSQVKGEAWTILIGLMDGRPYEVLGGKSEFIEIPAAYSSGKITKRVRKTMPSKYDLHFGENGNEVVVKDIVKVFDNPDHAGFTRIISLALRHGAPIHYIVEQLQKDRDAHLFSFARVVSRVLKKYINDGTIPGGSRVCPECGAEDSMKYQEGCVACTSCGYSKCS
ncbi:MAG: ribonucleoside-diphosphate reductase, adenosylcobalamin-dependent [Euryarchaeota archaeon]|nr:ribonucleoside-diphosphate reductase, adenosylcobalamin-dependent [Euryarchaeota archaeon]|tara:strand:+ start:5293 stop:7788 length:2496 start_codon:yes stop_codon:yes gene_type:complete